MRCPNCGATLIYNDTNRTYFCEYCGFTELAVEKVVDRVVYKEASPELNYNLVISNQSPYPFSEVRFNSSDANIHGSINKDETLAYKLVPGPHKITFRYGKYQETFVIVILDSGEPVKITYKGASGGSNNHYVIDQPYAGEAYKDLVNGKFPSEVTPLSVVALILSLTVILSFWGFILGIIDLGVSKNQGKKPSTTAVMAVTFGSIFMFIGLPMMISCVA